ncbi:uncharacterized protein LOC109843508 [Asparagus officinalis]|uniref:uncharacterized protein LOC109843508 n=1 Tax=Asparagus officinalis TaxID=4686 RepID=UPI00098E7F05|nr:uncharacterized protein LOC109843508 [Asparagus officinalis]
MVNEDWDSYHALRPIAQHRYEQARRRCLELKGTGRPPRRGRSATREQSFIPDIHRRAVIRWENGVSVGAFANAFNNFLAALARRHDFFNIFLTWKSQRIDALVACWRYICRFFFLDNNICAWTYCFAQINLSFKRWRLQVKKKYFVQITEDWERFWHLDERVDGVDFFVLCDYWDTAVIQAQAKIVRRNRNMPRSYEYHGGSRSFSQHYHQLELEEKLHAKVQEQMSQSQVGSNTLARLSREEDSIIETVIGPSRKNRYQWRGSEQRPHESSSTCESAAPPRTPGSSSYQDSMEQRLKAIEDWQSQQKTYQRIAEEERRRREQRELEFTQFISTLPQEAQEAYRRRFMSDQAGTSTQGAAGGSHGAAGVEDDDDDQED